MVRREVFDKIGLFKTHLDCADHDMWIRMSEVTKFYYLNEFLTAHRKHPGQTMTTKRKLWEDGFNVLKEAYKRHPYEAKLKHERLAILYYRLGEYDWNHKLYWRSAKHFLLAGMLDPLRGVEVFLSSLFDVGKPN